MKKVEIDDIVREMMSACHWELKSLWQLPKAYVRDIPITPAYVPGVVRRNESVYLITGYVGIINQKFEEKWLGRAVPRGSEPKKHNNFCLGLDIANFDALRNLRYINSENYWREVREFCSALTSLLERIPHDEVAMRDVLQHRELVGITLDKFVPFGRDEKFAAFKQFLKTSPVADEPSCN